MALKKLSKSSKKNEVKEVKTTKTLVQELEDKLEVIDKKIIELKNERIALEERILEFQIAPFKIGDYALVKVPSGKTTKEQVCLLECERGMLYVRPVKADGELSGRHFSLIPWGTQKYSDFLKEVK